MCFYDHHQTILTYSEGKREVEAEETIAILQTMPMLEKADLRKIEE